MRPWVLVRPFAFAVLTAALSAGCRDLPEPSPEPGDGLRESGPARYARTHPDFHWATADTANFRLYAEVGSGVEAQLETLGERAEAALRQARAYVGRRHAPGRIPIYFVESRERMRDLVGRTPGGMAVPKEDVAFFVATPGELAPALVHELTHLEAWEAFGERPADEPWLDEAVATAAVGRCHVYTLDEAAAAVLREGRDVPLAELAASFDVTDAADYLQAGSLMAWVRERWGLDAVATLWRGGLVASERATGLDPGALDAAWREHVTEPDRGTEVDWEAVAQQGCETPPAAS